MLPEALPQCVLCVSSLQHLQFVGFGCVFLQPQTSPHAASDACHPTKIRALSWWEGKALLIPEHRAQTKDAALGTSVGASPSPNLPYCIYLFVYHNLTFSFLSSLATDLFAKCFSSCSAPMPLLDPTESLPPAPAMSHRSPHLAHELFTPFAGCLVHRGVVPLLILRCGDRLRTGSVALIGGRGARQRG